MHVEMEWKRAGSCAQEHTASVRAAHLSPSARAMSPGSPGFSDRSDKDVLPWFPNPCNKNVLSGVKQCFKKKKSWEGMQIGTNFLKDVLHYISAVFQIVILFDTNNFTPKNLSQRNHQKWCQRLRY